MRSMVWSVMVMGNNQLGTCDDERSATTALFWHDEWRAASGLVAVNRWPLFTFDFLCFAIGFWLRRLLTATGFHLLPAQKRLLAQWWPLIYIRRNQHNEKMDMVYSSFHYRLSDCDRLSDCNQCTSDPLFIFDATQTGAILTVFYVWHNGDGCMEKNAGATIVAFLWSTPLCYFAVQCSLIPAQLWPQWYCGNGSEFRLPPAQYV